MKQNQPQADELLVDGSALVHSLRPTRVTFEECAEADFGKKIHSFVLTHSRVDVIFDQYKPDSLKPIQECRGV